MQANILDKSEAEVSMVMDALLHLAKEGSEMAEQKATVKTRVSLLLYLG